MTPIGRTRGVNASTPALLVLVLVAVVLLLMEPSLVSSTTAFNILSQASVTVIIAAGFAVAMMAGQLDLSVAATAVLAGVVAMSTQDMGFVFSVVAGLSVGVAVGLLNGLLVTGLGVPSLLATLGTLIAARGVSFWYADGRPVQGQAPEVSTWLNQSFLGVLSTRILLAIVVVIAIDFTIRRTVWGRRVMATGGNARAAMSVGINVNRTTMQALVLSGLLAAAGGTLQAYLLNSATPAAGDATLVAVIAGVVVGGVALTGGRGSVAGGALGVLLIATVTVGMNVIGVDSAYQRILIGALLLLVVFTSAPVLTRLLGRWLGGGRARRSTPRTTPVT